jgi:hypothetical protein
LFSSDQYGSLWPHLRRDFLHKFNVFGDALHESDMNFGQTVDTTAATDDSSELPLHQSTIIKSAILTVQALYKQSRVDKSNQQVAAGDEDSEIQDNSISMDGLFEREFSKVLIASSISVLQNLSL